MIARTWCGATRAEDAEEYVEYLRRTGFAHYRSTPGNRGVFALCQVEHGRAEFQVISLWESEEAIRRFAGEPIERAVFYPEDDRFLIQRDLDVQHQAVVYHSLPLAAGGGVEAPPG
jgi:heme-degrading monooxygenase HmoA